MTNPEQPVAVTQADRDRLLEILALWDCDRKQDALDQVARHRIAAEQAQRERDARKIEKEADAHAGKWSGMDQRETVKSLALAIRKGDAA